MVLSVASLLHGSDAPSIAYTVLSFQSDSSHAFA